MTTFLFETASFIHQNFGDNTKELMIVLPNKRGSLFLKQHLAKIYKKTIWLPKIVSAEEFIGEISGTQLADNISLIALLYNSYVEVMKDKAESFDLFIKWANLMLQDFNEIDRYLVDANAVYKNLGEIKEIENWSLAADEKTELQSNYIKFMSSLGDIYTHFTKQLIHSNQCYQGLSYKRAVENVKKGNKYFSDKKIIFAGFNALNRAEEVLFEHFITEYGAQILWDADRYYLDDEMQEAGMFLRKHFTKEFFRSTQFIGDHLKTGEKNIQVLGAPQNMAQVGAASTVLQQWIHEGKNIDRTAIVLCDESLLFPVLSVLPDEIDAVNVSLEYPLKQSTLYDLAEQLLCMHINKKNSSIYYKDLLRVIQNPYFNLLLQSDNSVVALTKRIASNNISYFSINSLRSTFGGDYEKVKFLFEEWDSVSLAVAAIRTLAIELMAKISSQKLNKASLELEFAYEFNKLCNQLEDICTKVNFISELKTLRHLVQQLLSGFSVPFFGEPLKGLQIMGVLETRTLDFENLILISVNENILPSGKSANTFIPFDLKRYFKLPVYQEKDAIYAYHFYRLIQRASNITLIYNTEADTFGKGEKSRFITQLLHELPSKNPNIAIKESIATPPREVNIRPQPIVIEKDEHVLQIIKDKARAEQGRSGFSPSLLNTYKDCTLRFYFNYVAKIKEQEEVEENIEAGTFGTILHSVLEQAFTPYKNKYLNRKDFESIYPKLEIYTNEAFREIFKDGDFSTGKNYLAYITIQNYANQLIKSDEFLFENLEKAGSSLMIKELECTLDQSLNVLLKNGETISVKMSGTLDRIDRTADHLRILDYKSSVSDNDSFYFTDFTALFSEKKYNKAFQLFFYAWLIWKKNWCNASEIQTAIIPFSGSKNSACYLLIAKDQKLKFTDELLSEFEAHLVKMITEMFDAGIHFVQTDESEKCKFCAFNAICDREEHLAF